MARNDQRMQAAAWMMQSAMAFVSTDNATFFFRVH